MRKNFIKIMAMALAVVCMAFAFVGCNSIPQSANIYSGTEEPTAQHYFKEGDFYFDEDDGDIYKYTADGWTVVKNVSGTNGVGIVDVQFYFDTDDYGQQYMVHVFLFDNDTKKEIRTLVSTKGFAGDGHTLVSEINNADDGDTIGLTHDIVLTQGVTISKDITINLNGHNISAPTDEVGDGVFHVIGSGKLTINGEGTINGANATDWAMAIWVDGGEVVINGGTYTNVGVVGDDAQYDLIYVKNGGKLTINGGKFVCKTPKWTLNKHDSTNNVIEVKGGQFICYNPAKAESENPVDNFVANGYEAVEIVEASGAWYTQVKKIAE